MDPVAILLLFLLLFLEQQQFLLYKEKTAVAANCHYECATVPRCTKSVAETKFSERLKRRGTPKPSLARETEAARN